MDRLPLWAAGSATATTLAVVYTLSAAAIALWPGAFLYALSGIVLGHEERFDGTGHPHGLTGEAIPLWARLFAVIDTLDAVTSDRTYCKGLPFDAVKAEILRLSGAQSDPVAEEDEPREMVELKCGKASIPAMQV